MIDGKIIKAGYGDLAISSNFLTRELYIQQIKPPLECGEEIRTEIEYIGDEIGIKLTYDSYRELNNLLTNVEDRIISIFEFGGYIFDFTNYHEGSIKSFRKHMVGAMRMYFMCIAA